MQSLSARAKRKLLRRLANDRLLTEPRIVVASQLLPGRRPVDLAARLAVRPPRKPK